MAGFISELKWRNVIRVALAYMAVARLLLQVVATVRSQKGSEYFFRSPGYCQPHPAI